MVQYNKVDSVRDPVVGTAGSAGIDFFIPRCAGDIVVPAFGKIMIPLGVRVIIPKGYVMLLQDKSGVANKLGLHTIAGVIDSDYRGQVHACFINPSSNDVTLHGDDKIIQGVVVPYINELQKLNDNDYEDANKNWGISERGAKGFGHGTDGNFTVTSSSVSGTPGERS